MSADGACRLDSGGRHVGMSGFTGAGYPQSVRRHWPAHQLHAAGEEFTSACGLTPRPRPNSTAHWPRSGIDMRPPCQSDRHHRRQTSMTTCNYRRTPVQRGAVCLVRLPGQAHCGVGGVAGVLPDGRLIPSSSVGNSKTWLGPGRGILESQPAKRATGLEGMHDIYGTRLPPHHSSRFHDQPGERIGED
jgi:succinyl-CoA:acetate CoA-transferase